MRVNIIVGLILFGATALLAQESLRIRLEENEQSFWTKAQLGDLEWRFWYASQGPLLGAKQRGAVGLAYGDFYLGPLAFRSPAGLPGKWAAGGGSSSIDELWRTSRQWKDHSSSTFGVLYHGDWGGWAWADAKDKSGLIDLGYLSPAKIGWQWGLGLKVAWEEDPGTEENCLQEMDWDQVLWGTLAYESTSALVYLSYHQLLALPELLGLQFPPWGMVSLGGDWEPWEKHVSLTALLWWATPSLLYSPLEEYAELGLRGILDSDWQSTSFHLAAAWHRLMGPLRLPVEEYSWEGTISSQALAFLQAELGWILEGVHQPRQKPLGDDWDWEIHGGLEIDYEPWTVACQWQGQNLHHPKESVQGWDFRAAWEGKGGSVALALELKEENHLGMILGLDPFFLPGWSGEFSLGLPWDPEKGQDFGRGLEGKLTLQWEKPD